MTANKDKTSVSYYEGSRVVPNNPFIQFLKEDINQSISGRFERVTAHCPSHIAIKVKGQAVTYDSLNKMANRIAHAISSKNDKHNHPVAVLVENNPATIAAILGVLKAAKIYVPLDASYSPAWAKYILDDTGAEFVLAGPNGLRLAQSWVNSPHTLIDVESLVLSDWSEENPALEIPPNALSHILYTSGSTARPKGVMDTHRNTLHYVMRLTNASHISPNDRITLVRPPSSSGALMNLYLALLNGASLFPIDLKQTTLSAVAQWLRQERITIFHAGATVFRHFAYQIGENDEFPDLRLIRLSSGQVFDNDVELFKRRFHNTLLLHVLSSTEANTYRVHFLNKESPVPDGTLPVGYAVEDMDVVILDDSGTALPAGEIGEIAIRSAYLFPGYWRNAEFTAAAFVNDSDSNGVRVFRTGDLGQLSSDGCLEYLGRKDFRLKIRGHSIQAEEVEMALQQIPGIAQAAVAAHKDSQGDDRLIAYISAGKQNLPTVGRIRESLKERLPDYMLPTKFVILRNLPLHPNGKVNRQELPAPGPARPNLGTPMIEPSTAVQAVITKVWSDALGISDIGVHDIFFELGGDSIVAGRIIARIEKLFGWSPTLPEFYDACTTAKFADLLMERVLNTEAAERAARLFLEVDRLSSEALKNKIAEERNKRQTANRNNPS
jgi:amino acid adenylation domain-containing protein